MVHTIPCLEHMKNRRSIFKLLGYSEASMSALEIHTAPSSIIPVPSHEGEETDEEGTSFDSFAVVAREGPQICIKPQHL